MTGLLIVLSCQKKKRSFFSMCTQTANSCILYPGRSKIENLFMLSVCISNYGCRREVWRALKMRKSCSRHSREQL